MNTTPAAFPFRPLVRVASGLALTLLVAACGEGGTQASTGGASPVAVIVATTSGGSGSVTAVSSVTPTPVVPPPVALAPAGLRVPAEEDEEDGPLGRTLVNWGPRFRPR